MTLNYANHFKLLAKIIMKIRDLSYWEFQNAPEGIKGMFIMIYSKRTIPHQFLSKVMDTYPSYFIKKALSDSEKKEVVDFFTE